MNKAKLVSNGQLFRPHPPKFVKARVFLKDCPTEIEVYGEWDYWGKDPDEAFEESGRDSITYFYDAYTDTVGWLILRKKTYVRTENGPVAYTSEICIPPWRVQMFETCFVTWYPTDTKKKEVNHDEHLHPGVP